MNERRYVMITVNVSEQPTLMHANTVAEAMKLFDNLIKVNLADVESDENVRNIVQLLDAKLEHTI